MYESFYGFKEKPFSTLPDPDFLYLSKNHEMALTYLEYGLSSQAGFIVLTGEIGSGKTTLINYLTEKIDNRKTKLALVFNTHVTPRGFLENILKEWGLSCTKRRKAELHETLNDFLITEYRNKTNVILIIDEAQNLTFETLEEIRMISNLNDDKIPLLHIILSGQPNLINRLNNPRLEQLRQRVAVHYHLDPLNREETFLYIHHRLARAQAPNPDIFKPEAVESIYDYSAGIPRVINLICDLTLVYGYAEQEKTLDKSIVNMVVADRKKMGLEFGHTAQQTARAASGKTTSTSHTTDVYEKKYKDLHNNVYELAQLVRTLIQSDKPGRQYRQELDALDERIKSLEEKLSKSSHKKNLQNYIRKWLHAEITTKNHY